MGIIIGERDQGSLVAKNNGTYADDNTAAQDIIANFSYTSADNKFNYQVLANSKYTSYQSSFIAITAPTDKAVTFEAMAKTTNGMPFNNHRLDITGSSQNDTINFTKIINSTVRTGLGNDVVDIICGNNNTVYAAESITLTIKNNKNILGIGNKLYGNENDNFFDVNLDRYTRNNWIFAGAGNDTVKFAVSPNGSINHIDAGDGNDSVDVTAFAAVTLGSGEDTLSLAAGARVSLYDLTSDDEIRLSSEVTAATLTADKKNLTFTGNAATIVLTGNNDLTLWQNAKVNGDKTLGELMGLTPQSKDSETDTDDGGDATKDDEPHTPPAPLPQPPVILIPTQPTATHHAPSSAVSAVSQPTIAPAVGIRYSIAASELTNERGFIQMADINRYTLCADGNLDFVVANGDTVTALLPENDSTDSGRLVKFIDANGRKMTFGYNGGENFTALDGSDSKMPVYWDGTWSDNTGQLIGSKYNDTIKAAYGETVYGGRGSDHIELMPNDEAETVILTTKGGSDSVYGFQSGFDNFDSDIVKFAQDELFVGGVKIDSSGNTIVKIGKGRVVLVNENNDNENNEVNHTDYILVENKNGRKDRIAVGARNATMSADTLTGEYADWYVGTGKSAVDFSDYNYNVVADLGNSGVWGNTANFLNIHTVMGAAGYDNILVGVNDRNDQLMGGKDEAANSLWGGVGGKDALIGGTDAENIYYFGTGNGQDTLQNIQSSDKVMFYNLSIGDLRELTWQNATCTATFTDGSRLTMEDVPENFIACFTDISYIYKKGRFIGLE